MLHVKAHQTNVGNNAADRLARNAASNISEIPSDNPDWDAKRIELERRPKIDVRGKPLARVVSGFDFNIAICV